MVDFRSIVCLHLGSLWPRWTLLLDDVRPMEAFLQECVQDALAACLHKNAIFHGERLTAAFPSEVSL
jgi:hypothetical protein